MPDEQGDDLGTDFLQIVGKAGEASPGPQCLQVGVPPTCLLAVQETPEEPFQNPFRAAGGAWALRPQPLSLKTRIEANLRLHLCQDAAFRLALRLKASQEPALALGMGNPDCDRKRPLPLFPCLVETGSALLLTVAVATASR